MRASAAKSAAVAVALLSSVLEAGGVMPPLPRVAFQSILTLAPKSASAASATASNVILIGEADHSASITADNICTQIAAGFNPGAYSGDACRQDIASRVRLHRGLSLQHDPRFSAAVVALETKLGDDGYPAREFDTTLYQRPYKAEFLRKLLAPGAGRGSSVDTFCDVGFGAGHSTLLYLSTRDGGDGGGLVYAFDHGLQRYSIPAHDFIDETYPNRLALLLGDSAVLAGSLREYYPGARCDAVYLDGADTYEGALADIKNFASLVSPDHVVVLANAGATTESGRAWRDAAAAGVVAWEGTLFESQARPDGDALVYGRYILPVAKGEASIPARP